jgi:uncharacterized membrane protein
LPRSLGGEEHDSLIHGSARVRRVPVRMIQWLRDRIGVVRLRQLLEDARHRLALVPLTLLAGGIVLSQVCLFIDRQIEDDSLPVILTTTVDSARSILGAIAGGLITAVTLLVSMVLVAVQLASGQLSPRTLRNWLGDPVVQRAVGVVLGTTVFCLLGLRSARQLGDDLSVVPSITVLVGVALGVISLIYVVRAVDRVTTNLQIGTIAQRLTDDTITTIRTNVSSADERPRMAPVAQHRDRLDLLSDVVPSTAVAVEADRAGWVQQIDVGQLLAALPDGATAWIGVVHGGYVFTNSPVAWIDLPDLDDERRTACLADVRSSFAFGPSRTMQQDVGFGMAQLTDIAVRALSPGTNDPQTARDILMHLGEILRELWASDPADATLEQDGRRVHRRVPDPEEHLRAALDPIRHYGRHDPMVMRTLADMLVILRAEIVRQSASRPVDPIDRWLDELLDHLDDDDWIPRERSEVRAAIMRRMTDVAGRSLV